MDDIFHQRGRSLEELFYAKHNATLLEKLRRREAHQVTKADIREATGITDEALLDKLVSLEVNVESLAALSLVPLVEVAWADRSVHDKEREAVLKAAEESGVKAGGPGYSLLENWLSERPDPQMLSAWKDYVAALAERLDDEGYAQVRDNLLSRARAVAKAAGGFLGMSKISAAEQKVLDQLEAAFHK